MSSPWRCRIPSDLPALGGAVFSSTIFNPPTDDEAKFILGGPRTILSVGLGDVGAESLGLFETPNKGLFGIPKSSFDLFNSDPRELLFLLFSVSTAPSVPTFFSFFISSYQSIVLRPFEYSVLHFLFSLL